MNFIHSFWPADNKYRESLSRLDERFQLSISENKQIVTFVQNWLAVQDLYGNGLKDLLEKKLFATPDKDAGNHPEDAASLGRAYKALKENCFNKGVLHLDSSKSIREKVLNPLQKTTQDHEDIYKQMKGEIFEKVGQFEKSQSILEIANKNYVEKCRIADKLEENAVNEAHRQEEANSGSPKSNNTYKLGKLTFTETDMKNFLKRAQSEGASQETKTMFLGLFRGLQSGEAIVQWLLHAYSELLSTPADAAEVGQALIDQNFLRLIGPGNQFRLASTAFYQWKKRADDDDESPHYRARKIAGEADLHYKDAVEKTEALRMEIEEYMHNYLIAMERNEEARIESIKSAFLNVAKIEATLASGLGPLVEALSPHLETLKPKQDVALMVETFATGPFRPRALLYQSQYHSPERDQSFGVSIEDQARFSKTLIPLTVSVLLKCLDEALNELSEDDRFNVWCNEAPLEKVHSCRASINNRKSNRKTFNSTLASPSPEALTGYDATVLVAALRLFLLELPDSLIPGHLYENLKTACSETDDNLRWDSITSCLAELSLPQRATLNALISRLRTASKSLQQSDESFHLLLSTYTNCIMRPPPQFSAHAFHHRHPQRVLKDLLLHPEGLVSTPDDKELSDWLIASPQLSKRVSEESVGSKLQDPAKSDIQNKGTSAESISGVSEKISEDDDYLDLDLAHLDDAGQDSGAEVNLKDDFFDDI